MSNIPDPRYPPLYMTQPPLPAGGRAPPPLPPRPPDLEQEPPPVPNTPRPSMNPATPIRSLKYPHKDEVFTLPELVEKHQNLFPLKVVVAKGHYGDRGEDSAIATDEIYNIHFIKKSKVFTVKDHSGYEYIVPLNSACKFGLYYQKGTCFFETVEDVMKASPLPEVIAAQASHVGSSTKNSVSRLEILVIKGITKGRIGRKPILNVYSVSKKEEKQLTKEVCGRFTTDPCYTHMYLTDLVRHVQLQYPITAHLYPDFDVEGPNVTYLSSEKMKIINDFIETSVVTSPMFLDQDDDAELNEHVVDIPLSLPIEVSVLPPEDDDTDDYEQLYEATRTLISGYNPVLGKTLQNNTSDEYSYASQSRIFSAVRKGFESEGLKIEMPKGISHSKLPNSDMYEPISPSHAPTGPRSVVHSQSVDNPQSGRKRYESLVSPSTPLEDYESMNSDTLPQATSRHSTLSPSRSFDSNFQMQTSPHSIPSLPPRKAATVRGTPPPPPRKGPLSSSSTPPPIAPKRLPQAIASSADGVFFRQPSSPSSTDSTLTRVQESLEALVMRVKALESTSKQENSSELNRQLNSLSSTVKSLQSTCSSLADAVSNLRKDMDSLVIQVNEISTISPKEAYPSGKITLKDLNSDQVVKLLEAMGPSIARYKEAFAREFVDGDLLSQCTEDILENDLGIKHKLDRMKLMQVIRGTKSVESILQGSYVQFEFNGAKECK